MSDPRIKLIVDACRRELRGLEGAASRTGVAEKTLLAGNRLQVFPSEASPDGYRYYLDTRTKWSRWLTRDGALEQLGFVKVTAGAIEEVASG